MCFPSWEAMMDFMMAAWRSAPIPHRPKRRNPYPQSECALTSPRPSFPASLVPGRRLIHALSESTRCQPMPTSLRIRRHTQPPILLPGLLTPSIHRFYSPRRQNENSCVSGPERLKKRIFVGILVYGANTPFGSRTIVCRLNSVSSSSLIARRCHPRRVRHSARPPPRVRASRRA